MNYLELHHFLPHLNEIFAATRNSESLSFVLVEAKPLGTSSTSRQPFSLLFFCEGTEVMPQSIYQLRHSSIGEFGVFLVPIDRNPKGVVYQAVFH